MFNDDRVLGGALLVGGLVGIVLYCWLLFISPWAWLTVRVSAFLAGGLCLLIISWIGYTLTTTPPPIPFEEALSFEREEKDKNESS